MYNIVITNILVSMSRKNPVTSIKHINNCVTNVKILVSLISQGYYLVMTKRLEYLRYASFSNTHSDFVRRIHLCIQNWYEFCRLDMFRPQTGGN